eukprot:5218183-Amphidinium_carterae.2
MQVPVGVFFVLLESVFDIERHLVPLAKFYEEDPMWVRGAFQNCIEARRLLFCLACGFVLAISGVFCALHAACVHIQMVVERVLWQARGQLAQSVMVSEKDALPA